MKKVLCLIYLLSFYPVDSKEIQTINDNEYNGQTKIVIFNKDEQDKTNLIKQLVYFDQNNNIIKIESIFTDCYAEEKKRLKQIDHYNKNKLIFKYEIVFHPDYAFQRNIDKIIEYVDKNDKLLKTEYYKNEKLLYSESVEKQKKYGEYQFLSLNFCEDYLKEANIYVREDKDDFLFMDTMYLCGRSIVTIIGDVKELDKNDLFFITEVWNKNVQSLRFEGNLKKILVSEDDKEFWIIVYEKDLKKIKNKRRMLIIFNFGGYNEMPIFMATELIECE